MVHKVFYDLQTTGGMQQRYFIILSFLCCTFEQHSVQEGCFLHILCARVFVGFYVGNGNNCIFCTHLMLAGARAVVYSSTHELYFNCTFIKIPGIILFDFKYKTKLDLSENSQSTVYAETFMMLLYHIFVRPCRRWNLNVFYASK